MGVTSRARRNGYVATPAPAARPARGATGAGRPPRSAPRVRAAAAPAGPGSRDRSSPAPHPRPSAARAHEGSRWLEGRTSRCSPAAARASRAPYWSSAYATSRFASPRFSSARVLVQEDAVVADVVHHPERLALAGSGARGRTAAARGCALSSAGASGFVSTSGRSTPSLNMSTAKTTSSSPACKLLEPVARGALVAPQCTATARSPAPRRTPP